MENRMFYLSAFLAFRVHSSIVLNTVVILIRCVSIGVFWNSNPLLAIYACVCDIFTIIISYFVYIMMHNCKTQTKSHSFFIKVIDDHSFNINISQDRFNYEKKRIKFSYFFLLLLLVSIGI